MKNHLFLVLIFCFQISIGHAQEQTYYQFLGVSQNASEAEIKLAVRRMLSQSHPDHISPTQTNPEFLKKTENLTKKILEVKKILLDSNQRTKYDSSISQTDKFKFEDLSKSSRQKPKEASPFEKQTANPESRTNSNTSSSTQTKSTQDKIPSQPENVTEKVGPTTQKTSSRINKQNLKIYESNQCGKGFLGAVLDELI